MSMRAKMQCEAVIPKIFGGYEVTFRCSYDDPTLHPEDIYFQKATPYGLIHMNIDNPEAIKQLVIGDFYYVDFMHITKDL